MKFLAPILIYFFLFTLNIKAQETEKYEWYNPLESVSKLQGQGWENIDYTRLPISAKEQLRKPVWALSQNSAGVSLRFITDADSLLISYEVDGAIAMPHMPATGVSGIDLYGKNTSNKWLWYKGIYHFGSHIQYHYKTEKSPVNGREYELYLPLYNTCKNLKIGTPKGSNMKFLTPSTVKPIVVYGTSIAQGACASRPGMAWTNILQRRLKHPIINLGFSGNGRLEPEVLRLLTEIDAQVYVLDCLPNLTPNEKFTETEIKKRLRHSILFLRKKRPQASILLTEHAGYSDGQINTVRKKTYETLNQWLNEVYLEFTTEGFKNISLLSRKEINLSNDAFVDGTHPTDLGMEAYARAYQKALTAIVKKE